MFFTAFVYTRFLITIKAFVKMSVQLVLLIAILKLLSPRRLFTNRYEQKKQKWQPGNSFNASLAHHYMDPITSQVTWYTVMLKFTKCVPGY